MKKIWVMIGVLLAVPLVFGQSEIGVQEDFENDTLGQVPSDTWYTGTAYGFQTGSAHTSITVTEAGALGGTDQGTTFRTNWAGSSTSNRVVRLELHEPQQFETMSFLWDCEEGGGDRHTVHIMGPNQTGDRDDNNAPGDADDEIFRVGFDIVSGECVPHVTGNAAPCGPPTADNEGWSVFVTFDWVNYEFDTTFTNINEGVTSCTDLSFRDGSTATGIGQISLDLSTVFVNSRSYWDQIQFDGGPLETSEFAEPTDFDSGLVAVTQSIGFVTPVSEMFLTLILVGLATVLSAKFTTGFEGKIRVWFIHGVVVAVGVFTIAVGYLDVWKFLLALTLSTVVHKGTSEILDLIRARNNQPEPEPPQENIIADFGLEVQE